MGVYIRFAPVTPGAVEAPDAVQAVVHSVSPDVHARLQEIADRRRTSLAATAADLLSAAVRAPQDTVPHLVDGALVASVLQALEGVTDPAAVVCRETAVELARAVEGRARGYTAAATALMEAADKALRTQQRADSPELDFRSLFLGL